MIDKIYHQKYKAVHREVNVEVDLDADKIVMATYKDSVIFGPFRVIFENNEFLCLERHVRSTLEKEPSYNTAMSAITYNNGKIITQESFPSGIDNDPSKGKNWNWEDYE